MTINGNNDYRSYANKRITKRIVELFNKMYWFFNKILNNTLIYKEMCDIII
jgi:hypothetical protein